MFKISSRNQMKHRAQRNYRKTPGEINTGQMSNNGSNTGEELSPIQPSPNHSGRGFVIMDTPTGPSQGRLLASNFGSQQDAALMDKEQGGIPRSLSLNPQIMTPGDADDDQMDGLLLDKSGLNISSTKN